ncbi:MAG: sulfite exporter TauE/SafE [Proteobacteria bacterium]|nr:sulfite exporter TauE/SafE [Pseudomonadota bacterium]
MIDDPLFYLAAIPAVVLTGLSKGGLGAAFGMAAVPILALVVSPVRAAGLMLPILLISDVVAMWSYRRNFSSDLVWHLMPAAVVGTLFGWATARYVSDDMLRLVVGILAIAFVARIFVLDRAHARKIAAGTAVGAPPPARKSALGAAIWGTLTGYTSFVAHSGGPPFQAYVQPMRLSPSLFAGTAAIFFGALNMMKVIPYAQLGQFTAENLTMSAILAPVTVGSTYLGVKLVRVIDERLFYRILTISVLFVGLKLIYDGSMHLLGL